jgi:hypothetical protein
MTRYQLHFGMLFLLLVVKGAVVAFSVMALVPIAHFTLDRVGIIQPHYPGCD